MKYQIVISAAQREFLLSALSHTQSSGYLGASASEREEIDLLYAMLDTIAVDNTDEPIHDLTA